MCCIGGMWGVGRPGRLCIDGFVQLGPHDGTFVMAVSTQAALPTSPYQPHALSPVRTMWHPAPSLQSSGQREEGHQGSRLVCDFLPYGRNILDEPEAQTGAQCMADCKGLRKGMWKLSAILHLPQSHLFYSNSMHVLEVATSMSPPPPPHTHTTLQRTVPMLV